MILDFKQTYLEFVRGDSFDLPLKLNEGSREFPVYCDIPENGSLEVAITLPTQPIENAIIKKVIRHSEPLMFSLSSEETSLLNLGKYYISVRYIYEEPNEDIPDGDTPEEPITTPEPRKITTIVNDKLLYVTGTPRPEVYE